MPLNTNGNHPIPTPPGAALYVDTENLRDNDHAQAVVARIIGNWPSEYPGVGSVSLYVRADKEALWQLWAETEFPALRVRVRGVQHFSNNKAKNSADLAITADAVADLTTGQAAAVAVVSNDSDFGALFVKLRELAQDAGAKQVPFLWITAPDGGGLSPEMERFIPAAFRWDLSDAPAAAATVVTQPAPRPLPEASPPALPAANGANPSSEAIADELIHRLPVGKFKVAEAHEVFKQQWPEHPAASGPAQLGTFLLKQIWPIMQRRGVVMAREKSPRTYEITPAAKGFIANPAPASIVSAPESAAREPTSQQLAAAVAAGITDDIFKASDAQDALKVTKLQHPAASYTAAQFGTWFAKQLWPIMEQHGVTIAKEKPRRYEMTPDARHNLTALA